MAYIEKRLSKNGAARYRALVRLRGHPSQSATFERKTDAKKWVQQTESAIREGRYFKSAAAKRHSGAELVDRYIQEILPRKPKSMHEPGPAAEMVAAAVRRSIRCRYHTRVHLTVPKQTQ